MVSLDFSANGQLLAYTTLLSGEAPQANYSPNDYSLLYNPPKQTQLMIWDIAAGEPLQLNRVLMPRNPSGHIYQPYTKSLVFSPDGTSIATISDRIIVRDLLTGKPIMTLESGLDPDMDLMAFDADRGESSIGVFSPDGKILASTWLIARSPNKYFKHPKEVVILWDVTDGKK